MCDNRGMILIESMILFMVMIMIVTLLLSCGNMAYKMNQYDQKGFHDDELQKIYAQ